MPTHLDRVDALMSRSTPLLSAADRDDIRAKLRADASAIEAHLIELDAGDTGTEAERTATSLQATIGELHEALLRLDRSEFGYCEDCGQWIAVARLLALPHTRYCLECTGRRRPHRQRRRATPARPRGSARQRQA